MELPILKNLPDNKLNRYFDKTAGLFIQHAKKQKLILPGEEALAKRHCSDNVLKAEWNKTKSIYGQCGAYDSDRKRIRFGSCFKGAVYDLGKKNLLQSAVATTTAVHEIGHTFQADTFEQMQDADYYYDEVVNSWAEVMVALSYFRNGGEEGIVDAKLEFCYDGLGSDLTQEDIHRWLDENLNYVLRKPDNGSIVMAVGYSEYYPEVLRLIKTMDISIKDAVRGATIFRSNHNIKEISKEYNRMYKGRSLKSLLASIDKPDAKRKTAHLAPLTLKDCQKYVKVLNGY